MGGIKKHHLPRGMHPSPEGKRTRCVGMIKRCAAIFFFVVGISYGLSVQTIRSEAKTSNQDDGIPKEIKQYCDEIGEEFEICPELLEAIVYHESRFIPTVKNKNCWGLCQVNVKIHSERIEKYDYTAEDMLEAYPNIMVAADLLAELFDTYGDDDPIVLSLYSGAGWAAVEKYKEYGITTKYVDEILTKSAEYERIHGK